MFYLKIKKINISFFLKLDPPKNFGAPGNFPRMILIFNDNFFSISFGLWKFKRGTFFIK